MDPAAEEHVAAMDDEVGLPFSCRLQGGKVIGVKIIPAPPPFDSGPQRGIDAEMGVGEEEYPNLPCAADCAGTIWCGFHC